MYVCPYVCLSQCMLVQMYVFSSEGFPMYVCPYVCFATYVCSMYVFSSVCLSQCMFVLIYVLPYMPYMFCLICLICFALYLFVLLSGPPSVCVWNTSLLHWSFSSNFSVCLIAHFLLSPLVLLHVFFLYVCLSASYPHPCIVSLSWCLQFQLIWPFCYLRPFSVYFLSLIIESIPSYFLIQKQFLVQVPIVFETCFRT